MGARTRGLEKEGIEEIGSDIGLWRGSGGTSERIEVEWVALSVSGMLSVEVNWARSRVRATIGVSVST